MHANVDNNLNSFHRPDSWGAATVLHGPSSDRASDRIDDVELQGGHLPVTKAFYAAAFGWRFVDYGPGYAGFQDAGIDGGIAVADSTPRQRRSFW